MTHTMVKLATARKDLKSAYKFNTKVTFTIENTEETCEIPADDVMLGILQRLIKRQEEMLDAIV